MLRRQPPEPLADLIGPNIGTEQNTLLLVKASGGVPDLRDVAIGPGNAAINLLILFPKTTVCLECNLHGPDIVAGSDGCPELRGEVVCNGRQYLQRNGAYDIVGLAGEPVASWVLIDDPCAGFRFADLLHDTLIVYRLAKPHREGLRNAIHPANWLQHGRGLFEAVAKVEPIFPKLRFEQLFETDRFSHPTLGEPSARRLFVTRSRRSLVRVVLR